MEDWVTIEFHDLDLGDKRVNSKAKKIITCLASQPGVAIPQAFNTWSEVKSCYEFFHNGKVDPDKILRPHKKATIERIKEERVVLLPQDTTTLNYTTKPSVNNLGNIGGKKNKGLFVHPLLALTPSRINLGIVDAKIWARDEREKKISDHEAYSLPIEEKEKFRWIEGYDVACEVAKECKETQVIVITDREGDFAELFEAVVLAQESGERYADIIVRSYHDRAIGLPIKAEGSPVEEDQDKFDGKLRSSLKQSRPLGEVNFSIPAGKNRPARDVTQTLKSAKVTFKKRSTGKGANNKRVTVNAVMAIEENPPEGVEPLTWIFLTTLPIETFEEVTLIIQYYLARWEIEIFFKILKSGCAVEERRLTGGGLTPLIAIFLIIAWRIMYAMKLGRTCPEASCEIVFSASEWKSVYTVLNRGVKLPNKPPSLGEFIKMIGRLGGYMNRKNDPPPGPKAIWIGINRMYDFALAWEAINSIDSKLD